MKPYGTRLMAWGPLAEGFNNFFKFPELATIAARHGKSVAQVALRYLVDREIIVIPKSVHVERMRENFALDDFSLTEADNAVIGSLDLAHGVVVDFSRDESRTSLYNVVKNYKV